MTPSAPPPVAGLPEGLELVRIGVAEDSDYELVGGAIFRGKRPGAASGVIVQPAAGYLFRQAPQRFDMRKFQLTNDVGNLYILVKSMLPQTITAKITFTLDNQYDLDALKKALENLKAMPGFVNIEAA